MLLTAKDGEVNNSKTYYKFRFDGILPMKISQALVLGCGETIVLELGWYADAFVLLKHVYTIDILFYVYHILQHNFVSTIQQHVVGYQPGA